MAKAIFTTKISPTYDDRPEEQYHFPNTYLNQARSSIGDHIIYYEPRRSSADDSSRGGRQAYFATARVEDVIPDPKQPDHFYALISPGSYLDFDRPVPFAEGGFYYESKLRKDDGTTNKGAFGRSVRNVTDVEFDRILRSGFAPELAPAWEESTGAETTEFAEAQQDFVRPIVELTILRPFRDRAFKRAIRSAYDNQCAMTGLRLINGGGRPEVQASHIKPVSKHGPDSIRNGLALSGTLHWLFDRGLLSVADNHEILVSKKKIPDQVRRLLNTNGRIIVPKDRAFQPHPYYLKFHRENVFKE
jgi:putative restriction endonuclease